MPGSTTNATSTTSANATTTTVPSVLKFSPQPIWEEKAKTTSATQINKTFTKVEFTGYGNMSAPSTGKKINMTSTGYAIVSGKNPVFAYGREHVHSPDGDSTAITYYEILQYNPATLQGKGITIAVFDGNATRVLAPFNNMVVVGTHEDNPKDPQGATITLWQWQGGFNSTAISSSMQPINSSSMNNSSSSSTSQLPQSSDMK